MKPRKEYIHNFTINLQRKVSESTEEVNDKNEKITVTKEVTKEVPVEIYVKNPSRALREEGDMFYSSVFSGCLRKGIFSEAMLSKQFKEIGSTLSEEEKRKYTNLLARYAELENEIQRSSLKGEEELKIKLSVEQSQIRDELVVFRATQNALFNNTADTISRNKTIFWYFLFLSHYKDKQDKIIPLFDGMTYEDKLVVYDRLEEAGEEIFSTSKEELTTFITFWYLGVVNDSEDFRALKDKA